MSQKTDKTTKKPYNEPKLRVYGNLETMTLTAMTGVGSDGGVHPAGTKST
jgi:hypothetical protein